jgi:hypothetical protein
MNAISDAANLAQPAVDARKQQFPTQPNGNGSHQDPWRMFGPEIILPIQHTPPRDAQGRCEGERRLMLAVLEDAVVSLKLHMRGPSVHSRRLVAEIENWLASGSRAHAFAFGTICDVLGFDISAVRQAVKDWTRAERSDPRYRRMHSGPGRHQIGLAERHRR